MFWLIKSYTHKYDNENEFFEAQIDIIASSYYKISTQKIFSCLITLQLQKITGDIKEWKTKCVYYQVFQSETPVFSGNLAETDSNSSSIYICRIVNRFPNRLFVISVKVPNHFKITLV